MMFISIASVLALSVAVAPGDAATLANATGKTGPTPPDASKRVAQAEPLSLGHGYSRRGNHIEFKGLRIDRSGRENLRAFERVMERPLVLALEVDAASFVPLSEEYAKDKNNVYYKWTSEGHFWVVEIPDADPATFEIIDFNLAKDARRVWRTDVPIKGADAATAHVVKPGFVWKDKHSVYYQFTRLSGADPKSFRHLEQAFYRDAKHIYWSSTRLKGADVNTFRTFGDEVPYAADEHHVWFGDTQIPNVDAASFRLLHNHIFADKLGVYVSGRALSIVDADATTFRKVAQLEAGGWGCVLLRDAQRAYIFDPYYIEVYTITQTRDAAVISKPVWFAELDGTVQHVATVLMTWKDGVLTEPSIEIKQGGESKPKPTWELGKMQRMSDMIRESLAMLEKEPAAAPDAEGKPLQQRGDK